MTAQASRQWVAATLSTDAPRAFFRPVCVAQMLHYWCVSGANTPWCGPQPHGAAPLSTRCGPDERRGTRQNPGPPLACPEAGPDRAWRPVLAGSFAYVLCIFPYGGYPGGQHDHAAAANW